ncbi:class I SAM-dependent methyltransferase [Yersinia enterocolitica]|nr:class I SAM-dependent methyltransferase [Yersinia enterocolitica]PNK74916.1 class I SAM-dependent methyltransferase [Yersinia enterocolitica]
MSSTMNNICTETPISSYSCFPSTYSMRFTPQRLSRAIDWHGHLCFAAWLMELVRPQALVELGVFRGDSLSTFSQAAKELNINCEITGVDTWGGDSTTGVYGEEVYSEVRDYFSSNFIRTTLFRGLFDDALTSFADDSVDILHIDGCHHYEAVKHDFESWLPKISKRNGVVLFHDTSVVSEGFGAKRYWNEIKDSYPSFSFVHSNGLGVLLVGKEQPDALLQLSHSAELLDIVRAIYELSGNVFLHMAKEKWWKAEADKHAAYVSHITSDVGRGLAETVNIHVVNYLNSISKDKSSGILGIKKIAKKLFRKQN